MRTARNKSSTQTDAFGAYLHASAIRLARKLFVPRHLCRIECLEIITISWVELRGMILSNDVSIGLPECVRSK